ncbi:DUF1616 domain-containing protein [Halorubrum amylolyticum]|uniref:DUF1616 domain-containing protein n=1 Tax=Halorubrum amylolyticum TaxID=2508724 RepID=UPI0013E8A3B2|nr:DUF1616 domain-containing protein [Halorubrum amylolyticum]
MIQDIPDDVWASLAAAVVLVTVVILELESSIRVAIVLPILLFLPGYALMTALFPEKRINVPNAIGRRAPQNLTTFLLGEDPIRLSPTIRFVLAVGGSVALLPLLGLLTSAVTGTITAKTAVVTLALFIFVATAVGTVRRLQTPIDDRYAPSFAGKVSLIKASVSGQTRWESILNTTLGISLLVAVFTTGFVLTVPNDGESYSTAALYGTDDDELVLGNLPDEMTREQTEEVIFVVNNHHDQSVDYTVVVKLQRQNSDGTVIDEQRLDTFNKTIAADQRWRHSHGLSPTFVGERVRVIYLVYEGKPPETPTRSNADADVYHWLTVTE